MRFHLALIVLTAALSSLARAQNPQPPAPILEPLTKLEALELRKGAVIVKGYSEIGRVDGENNTSIIVSAIEMRDTARNVKEMGLAITAESRGDDRRHAVTYLDYEEIAGLLAAMDYMSKPDNEATKLSNYEAQYRTRGLLEVVSFDNNNQRMLSVRAVQVLFPSGEIIWTTAHFRLNSIIAIRKLITDGKDLLDRANAPPEAK
jgi:hypothetical protein